MSSCIRFVDTFPTNPMCGFVVLGCCAVLRFIEGRRREERRGKSYGEIRDTLPYVLA